MDAGPCRERRLGFFIPVKKLAREIFELWQDERFEFEDDDGMGKEEEASGEVEDVEVGCPRETRGVG